MIARLVLLFASLTAADVALAEDLHDILTNLRDIIMPLTGLLMAISFIIGIILVFRGIGMLRKFGMPLTHMSQQGELAGPLVYFVVGAILIYLPTTSNVLQATLLGESSMFTSTSVEYQAMGLASEEILGYVSDDSAFIDQWADIADTLVLYIQFVGLLAFVRGWLIMSKSGQPGVQPGSISKGIVHIIAGVIAMNFVPVVEIVRNTLYGTS